MVGAVIYVRVSTKEQTENLSLPTQLRACEEYCRRQGYEVLERFHEEGESAKSTGSWSKGRSGSPFEMALREGAAGAGLQVALEADRGGLVRERKLRPPAPTVGGALCERSDPHCARQGAHPRYG